MVGTVNRPVLAASWICSALAGSARHARTIRHLVADAQLLNKRLFLHNGAFEDATHLRHCIVLSRRLRQSLVRMALQDAGAAREEVARKLLDGGLLKNLRGRFQVRLYGLGAGVAQVENTAQLKAADGSTQIGKGLRQLADEAGVASCHHQPSHLPRAHCQLADVLLCVSHS